MAESSERVPPTEADVRAWLETLSRWGQFGPDDERGTLNFIGPAERRVALELIRTGETVSCSLPITFDAQQDSPATGGGVHADPSWLRPRRYVIADGADAPDPETRFAAYDAFVIAPHGPLVTHIDAPAHTVLRGRAYNDAPASTATSDEHKPGTIEALRDGFVARGVLLDVAGNAGRASLDDGEAVYPADLETCEQRQGVRVGRGDFLMVRTGYRTRVSGLPPARHAPRPGLQAACLPWLHEREVSVLGADVAIDVIPHGYESLGLPIHAVGMWAMGLWLVDNCGLEALAEICRRNARWEFAVVTAPLILRSGTASPVNPIALF